MGHCSSKAVDLPTPQRSELDSLRASVKVLTEQLEATVKYQPQIRDVSAMILAINARLAVFKPLIQDALDKHDLVTMHAYLAISSTAVAIVDRQLRIINARPVWVVAVASTASQVAGSSWVESTPDKI